MTTTTPATEKTTSIATPPTSATRRSDLLDRYLPIGIASVRAAAMIMAAAAAKA